MDEGDIPMGEREGKIRISHTNVRGSTAVVIGLQLNEIKENKTLSPEVEMKQRSWAASFHCDKSIVFFSSSVSFHNVLFF